MQCGKVSRDLEGQRTEGKTDDDKISSKISCYAQKKKKKKPEEQMLGKNDLNPREN
jgi:hypothetical protein